MYEQIMNFLQENHFASGGILVVAFSSTLYLLRTLPGRIYRFIKWKFVYELEILDDDLIFRHANKWLLLQKSSKKIRKLNLLTCHKRDHKTNHWVANEELVPGIGTYMIKSKYGRIIIRKTRKEPQEMMGYKRFFYSIIIYSISKNILNKIIKEIQEYEDIEFEQSTSIFTTGAGEWKFIGSILKNKHSLILHHKDEKEIFHNLDSFMKNRKWYDDKGLIYKYNMLLYGPPGTGKSSLIKEIANHLNRDIGFVNINNTSLTDTGLIALCSPSFISRSILVMEDLNCDSLKENEKDKDRGGLTFSGLINILDGIISQEDSIVIFTTNDISKIDPILLRPGRINYIKEIGYAKLDQIEKMTKIYLEDDIKSQEVISILATYENRITTAQIQQILLRILNESKSIESIIKEELKNVKLSHTNQLTNMITKSNGVLV